MLLNIAKYEFNYFIRSPQAILFLVLAVFFGLITYPLIDGDGVNTILGGTKDVKYNSPFLITAAMLFLSMFAIFAIPTFVANSALKDWENKFDKILYAISIPKFSYLAGRFLGSFAAMMVVLFGAPIAMLMGELFLPLDTSMLAKTNFSHYLYVFLILILPSYLLVSIVVYAVAIVTRKTIYVYLTICFILLVCQFGFVAGRFFGPVVQSIIDPFLFNSFLLEARFWTPLERNANLLGFDSFILINRGVWTAIAGIFGLIGYTVFSFRVSNCPPKKSQPREANFLRPSPSLSELVNFSDLTWGVATIWMQFVARTRYELKSILKSLPFYLLLIFSVLFYFLHLRGQLSQNWVSFYPSTRLMVQALTSNLNLVLFVVTIYYSAELLWRERRYGFNHILDALPVPNWIILFSKFIALTVVLMSLTVLQVGISILWQVANGYTNFEMALYIERGIVYFLLPFFPIAVLAFFVQVFVANRFMGMLVTFLFLLLMMYLWQVVGLEHPLFIYGMAGGLAGDIQAPLSDMNRSGRFTEGGYWLRVYWFAVALLLLMVSFRLWVHGTIQPLRYRLSNLRLVREPISLLIMALVWCVGLGSGAFIFYNTNVINDYYTQHDLNLVKTEYENRYRQFQTLPMPRWTNIKSEVDIYPRQYKVENRSTQLLQNFTDKAISIVHFTFAPGVTVNTLEFEGALLESQQGYYNYSIFKLERPMLPGETRRVYFETALQERGFKHRRPNFGLVANGTFVFNDQLTPYIGFNGEHMLFDGDLRSEYGLAPFTNLVSPEEFDPAATNLMRHAPEFVEVETIVSTTANQLAFAPGSLLDEWVEGNRRYFHYKSENKIVNYYPYVSADYQRHQQQWKDVDINIYYHAPHDKNLSRIMESAQDSLDYFSQHFGPYPFKQLNILEVPAYHNAAKGPPNTIIYSENRGFSVKEAGVGRVDPTYNIVAHEVAHQWWWNQVMPAPIKGYDMLNETLASYSALIVSERKYGTQAVRQNLLRGHLTYLSGKSIDKRNEEPLYRVMSQDYVSYRKGESAMYTVKEFIGEEAINRSLRRLISDYAYAGNPTTIDYLDILKEEAGPNHVSLIEDLFKRVTFYDKLISDIQIESLADGQYKVILTAMISKYYDDNESLTLPLEYPVEIGLFSSHPADPFFSTNSEIYLGKHFVDAVESTIEIIVKRRPRYVGIDPYSKFFSKNVGDNIISIE